MRRLRESRGAFFATVKIPFTITDAQDGDVNEFYFDHGDYAIEEDETILARFRDNPLPWADEAPGFSFVPVVDGTDGTKFKLLVTYNASEYVYGQGYTPGTGSFDGYIYRRGVLRDEGE